MTCVQGLDLTRLADKQQFAFIDGLSELFYAPQATAIPPSVSPAGLGSTPRTTLPMRSPPGAVPGRSPQPVRPAAMSVRGNVASKQAEPGIAKKLHFTGHGLASLDTMENDICSVIEEQKSSMGDGDELLLIIDQPDLLLAATGPSMGIGATEMAEWITGLQQVRRHHYPTVKSRFTIGLTISSTACTCYDPNVGYGCPADTKCIHIGRAVGDANRDGACGTCYRVGASGSLSHAAPHSGYGSRKRRERGVENQPRWWNDHRRRREPGRARGFVLHST